MLKTTTTSNIDAVLREAQQALSGASGPSEHVLEVRNVADYAEYLEAREAFTVLNDDVLADAVHESLAERMEGRGREGRSLSDEDVVEALGEAGDQVVSVYQQVIGTTDEPGKVKLPPRPVHTGGFASDTEVLISSYQSRVDGGEWEEYPY